MPCLQSQLFVAAAIQFVSCLALGTVAVYAAATPEHSGPYTQICLCESEKASTSPV